MSPGRGRKPGAAACRSILFVPGDRPDRFAKAMASGADAVCIDLEDAVPPGRKDLALSEAVRFATERATGGGARPGPAAASRSAIDSPRPRAAAPLLIVRLNAPDTAQGRRDAAAFGAIPGPGPRPGPTPDPRPDAFMIPKTAGPETIRSVQHAVGAETALIPLIETAAGLERAAAVAASSPAVTAIMFGGFDLAAELGAEPQWEPLLYARSRVVHAAALAGIAAVDKPSRDFRDTEAVQAEADRARRMGFAGKAAIHPAQIAPIHAAFAPSRGEVDRARRIVETDRASKGAAAALDGRMVDRPVVEAARRVLERAAAAGIEGAGPGDAAAGGAGRWAAGRAGPAGAEE